MEHEKDSRERIINEMVVLLDRAFALGRAQGRDETLARIRQAVADGGHVIPISEGGALPATGRTPRPRLDGYGNITNTVRAIVADHDDVGISRKALTARLNERLGRELKYSQVTEALRSLSSRGEIESRDRKWFPGPQLDRRKASLGLA